MERIKKTTGLLFTRFTHLSAQPVWAPLTAQDSSIAAGRTSKTRNLLLLLLVLVLPVLAVAQSWQAEANYLVSDSPIRRVLVGDVDGDRATDVLFINDAGLNLLRGNAQGELSKTPVLLRAGVFDAVMANFKGNGRLDLVVLGYDAEGRNLGLYLLANDNGAFKPTQIESPAAMVFEEKCFLAEGNFLSGVARNVVVTCPAQHGVLMLGANDGTGLFNFSTVTLFSESRAVESLSAGDFDLDRHGDLVLVTRGDDGSLHTDVAYGDGKGGFTLMPATLPSSIKSVMGADFNGNGNTDLFVLDSGGTGAYLSMDAKRAFKNAGTITSSLGCSMFALGAGRVAPWHLGVRALDLVAGQNCEGTDGHSRWGIGIYRNTRATEMALTPTAMFKKARYYYRIDVAVKAVEGKGVPTGEVLLAADNRTVKHVKLVNGAANFEIQLAKGSHKLMAAYAGDANYAAASTGIIINANNQDKSNLPLPLEPYTTTELRKRRTDGLDSAVFSPDTDRPQLQSVVAGGWAVSMSGIGVAPGGPYTPGQAITFSGQLSSGYTNWFDCGADFSCYGVYAPTGILQLFIDGIYQADVYQLMITNYESCGQDRDGNVLWCESDWSEFNYTTSSIPPGTHTIRFDFVGTDMGGPAVSYGNASQSVIITIAKASPTITVSSTVNPSTYGQSTTFTATFAGAFNPTGVVTFKDGAATLGTGAISGNSATFPSSSLGVGAHSITATYAGDAANNPATSSALNQTVNKATPTVTVTCSPGPNTYGPPTWCTAHVSSGTGTVTFNNAWGTYSVDGSGNATVAGVAPAGTYSVTGTYNGDANYNSAVGGPVTLTINKAPLTVTANTDLKTYGATKSYGAGSSAFTSSGLQNGETIGSVTITASGGTAANAPVSSYTLTPSAAIGGTFNAANYNITYNPGTLTVNKAALSITANADSKTYGATKTYGPGSVAFTSVGLQNGETIGSVTITASGGTAANAAVGTYSLTPSAATGGTFSAGNYTITYNSGTLTVNKAALSVSANADSKTYGSTKTYGAGSVAFTSSGLQNGETIGTVTITASGGTTATAAIGSYLLTPSAAIGGTFVAGNYTITYNTGTLTVSKATVAVSATSTINPSTYRTTVTFTFTFPASGAGALPTGTATLTEGATNLGTLTLDAAGKATYTSAALAVGAHTLKITYGGDPNYQ